MRHSREQFSLLQSEEIPSDLRCFFGAGTSLSDDIMQSYSKRSNLRDSQEHVLPLQSACTI